MTWLILALAVGLMAGGVMEVFEDPLEAVDDWARDNYRDDDISSSPPPI